MSTYVSVVPTAGAAGAALAWIERSGPNRLSRPSRPKGAVETGGEAARRAAIVTACVAAVLPAAAAAIVAEPLAASRT